ncbi:MAG: Chemotaxis protein CheY [Candidatus Accumulibacter sp. BA-94]|uniref:response regulator transcription factor n=1 Tax=Accumulibacter sp. TaxID=2053492 RepID=UPI000446E5C0|nr:response regulator [Accumulibacter sp.]EXI85645.1 MAG: Chemotaxis protein CheY [Candidatus Accumulibacter sp. BA-94]HRD87656.1 response regulator [Accumulibacter sp.]
MTGKSRPSILIVDDNDLMRSLMRCMLRDSEYEVIGEARNGVAALELAERLRPQIICMDLVMPEMNGLEALQAIKARHPEMVVVMLTGSASVDDVRASIQNGASGFIVKPFNAGKMLDTVDRAWRAARQTTSSQPAA